VENTENTKSIIWNFNCFWFCFNRTLYDMFR